MFRKFGLSILAVYMLGLSQLLAAEPLSSMNQVSVALQRCWSKTAFAQHDASVTLRFGFKRDGTLLGQPKPSAIVFSGSPDQRRVFVNAAIEAINECTPGFFAEDCRRRSRRRFLDRVPLKRIMPRPMPLRRVLVAVMEHRGALPFQTRD